MSNMLEELIEETELALDSYITDLDTCIDHSEFIRLGTRIYHERNMLWDLKRIELPESGVSKEDFGKVRDLANKYMAHATELMEEKTTLKADIYSLQLFIENNVPEEKQREIFNN